MSQQNFDSQEGLSFLARETGGFAVLNNNDLNLGIQQAVKDQQSYYLIGFDPEDEKFDQKYHSIKLKVGRPGLQVRTRAGFIGRPETGARPEPPRTRDAQILSALFSPFGARDLSMQMTSFFFNTPNPNRKLKNDPETISFVRSLFNIDMSKLSYKDEPDGKKSIRLAIVNFTFNENGAIIEQHGREFTMPLDEKMIPIAMSKGLNYTDDFVIKKPGAYQFRAVIRDAETGKLGSAGQFIQVPDLSKNRLALSGLVLTPPPEEMSARLRGCGLNDWEIESSKRYNPNTIIPMEKSPINFRKAVQEKYHSCVISYSSRDEDFAKRLRENLQRAGVRCWIALNDLKIGDEFRQEIGEAIRQHDKLLLILSEGSIESHWVKDECEAARERERKEGKTVLFPIKIDNAISDSNQEWALAIRRTRHIGDFRNWSNSDDYNKALEKLLSDLKQQS